jgi:hypothetical protein
MGVQGVGVHGLSDDTKVAVTVAVPVPTALKRASNKPPFEALDRRWRIPPPEIFGGAGHEPPVP